MKNKFSKSRKSHRLPGWNYSSDGHYFVTICTKNKKHYFGKVFDKSLSLNELGKITRRYWLEIPNHFNNAELDEFIIMPNHIHGILILHNCRDVALQRPYNGHYPNMSRISPSPNSLSTIIRSFKSIVTKTIKLCYPQSDFAWQPRFYDHIISSDTSWYFMQEYIINNPANWKKDKYF